MRNSAIVERGPETSYPFLRVALVHNVPYADVLRCADVYDRTLQMNVIDMADRINHVIETMSRPCALAVIDACNRERRRRKCQ